MRPLEGRRAQAGVTACLLDGDVMRGILTPRLGYSDEARDEFYAVLGDSAKALDWLDRAVRAGDERADWFERDPLLTSIRQEPRFRQIVDGIRYRQELRREK